MKAGDIDAHERVQTKREIKGSTSTRGTEEHSNQRDDDAELKDKCTEASKYIVRQVENFEGTNKLSILRSICSAFAKRSTNCNI